MEGSRLGARDGRFDGLLLVTRMVGGRDLRKRAEGGLVGTTGAFEGTVDWIGLFVGRFVGFETDGASDEVGFALVLTAFGGGESIDGADEFTETVGMLVACHSVGVNEGREEGSELGEDVGLKDGGAEIFLGCTSR